MNLNHAEMAPRAMSRRSFLRYYGIASSALTFSPFFIDRMASVCQASASLVKVFKVLNGDCFQNTARIWEMLGGPGAYIGPNDIVVIKGNAQWPNQGYTNTGCIKGVIDQILALPGFAGEILICDNTQNYGSTGGFGFDATVSNRWHNWPNHNWESLASEYQANGKPVATKHWVNGPWRSTSVTTWNPAQGEGWHRSFFSYNGRPTYLSAPVFQSPLTPGRMIDMKNGVWENGSYTGRKVKTIFMPTLNNHGWGGEDYAGVTSAIKCFFGATEILSGQDAVVNGYYNIHSSSYTQSSAQCAGELAGRYINTMYSPSLYITPAMWSGWSSRTGDAAATNAVLACANPVTLDYIACRDVISPYASWLNPDQTNNTRRQLVGCNNQGIGTLDPSLFQLVTYDFNNPATTRLDIDRKIRDFKAGVATEQEVKDVITQYMQGQ